MKRALSFALVLALALSLAACSSGGSSADPFEGKMPTEEDRTEYRVTNLAHTRTDTA